MESSREARDCKTSVTRPGKFEKEMVDSAKQSKAEERHKTNNLVWQKHNEMVVGRGRKITFK